MSNRIIPLLLAVLSLAGIGALTNAVGATPGDGAQVAPDGADRPGPGPSAAARLRALTGPEPAPLPPEPQPGPSGRAVVVRGSGWGHSVGMSQYGAQAQALAGRDYRDILGHYYPGVELAVDPAADEGIRVALFRNRGDIDASRLVLQTSSVDGQAPDRDVTVDLRAGDEVAVPFPERWELRPDPASGELVLLDADGEERGRGPGPALVGYQGEGTTLLRLPQLAPQPRNRVAGTFRHGVLEVTARGARVNPVVSLTVEAYLGGLAEMPSGWEVEALKAQAVAGRTFAVRKVRQGRDEACRCHLGATPHDQVFVGWGKEGAWRGDAWRRAVSETAGEVATHDGDLAWTYYSSSHGGATEDSGESWAYPQTLPYLRSVDDPWSLDPAVSNPYARWERRIDSTEFARAVGLADVLDVEIASRTSGGTPRELVIEGVDADGERVRVAYRGPRTGVAGSDLKLAFRALLPSQQFTEIEVAGG